MSQGFLRLDKTQLLTWNWIYLHFLAERYWDHMTGIARLQCLNAGKDTGEPAGG